MKFSDMPYVRPDVEKVRAELVVQSAQLDRAVTVSIRFDNAAQLDAIADRRSDRVIIRLNSVHIDLRPQSAGKDQLIFFLFHHITAYST